MINMKKLFYFFKWKLIRSQAFDAWSMVKANENKSLEETSFMQQVLLKRVVKHAMEKTLFYSKRYKDAGFELGDMEQEGWFEKLPVVTKDDLRSHFGDFVDMSQRQYMRISTTGGSTGTPIKTGYDLRIPEEVFSWRLQQWYGVNPWDDHAYVWRDTRQNKLAKFYNAVMWWPTKHLKLDATFITDEKIESFIRRYNRLKPALLQGYVGAITQLAEYVLSHKIEVHKPKFVWVTSAPLPESQRVVIGNAFCAPVCDQYGSCELRWIASQCPLGHGLHVNVEHVYVEFVDDNNVSVPKGQYGKTLLTNLDDTVFPLIRYENGDRGRWLNQACTCGRSLPLIDSVKGRESESFVLPSGKTINGEYLTTIFDDYPDIVRGFRVIQHKDFSISVEYIPAYTNIKGPLKTIEEKFRKQINNEVTLTFIPKEEIVHDRGKLRFVVRER
jgi:phenylacetate-CoA ligase